MSLLACSLVGKVERVTLLAGSVAQAAYGAVQAEEAFACNYGLNPVYANRIAQGPLVVSGKGPDGEARIIELRDRRFYVGTLFLPQLSSTPEKPHPLIVAYLRAAQDLRS